MTALPTWAWTEHEDGLMEHDGDIGGDNQVGGVVERRYHRQLDDGTWSVITDSWIVEQTGSEDEPRYSVTNRIEFLNCRDLEDVGGTEISSDYETEYVGLTDFVDLDEALAKAAGYGKRAGAIDYEHWNGVRSK
ncbi:hypothetical protein ACFVAJ_17545 [Agromyces sp. NPDC057679]|uniref:hypothetical protein n=1 Tax=Agromyces sp. NPDC057679 TaxID=3346207 RepID=UPI0036708083